MKNKKIISALVLSLYLCSFAGCSNAEPSGPVVLPQGEKIEEEVEEVYNPDSIIDRMDYDVLALFEKQPLEITSRSMLTGIKDGKADSLFDRIYGTNCMFDINYNLISCGYEMSTSDGALIITSNDGCLRYKIYRISSASSNFFHNADKNEKIQALKSRYDEIKDKYYDLYSIACQDSFEHTGEGYYDDAQYGSYYTYVPMVEFVLQNGLQYDIPLYSESQVIEILDKFFDLPASEDYYYLSASAYSNRRFGRSGIYLPKEASLTSGFQYYLIYDNTGVYAVENYYTLYNGLDNESLADTVLPAYSDADLLDNNVKYTFKYRTSNNVPQSSEILNENINQGVEGITLFENANPDDDIVIYVPNDGNQNSSNSEDTSNGNIIKKSDDGRTITVKVLYHNKQSNTFETITVDAHLNTATGFYEYVHNGELLVYGTDNVAAEEAYNVTQNDDSPTIIEPEKNPTNIGGNPGGSGMLPPRP